MKHNFQFQNLLGTAYRKGNILFTSEGDNLISPVGNRITFLLLKKSKSETLSLESSLNITTIALSPDNSIIIAINEEGDAYFYSLISYSLIQTYSFLSSIKQIKFSPDGKHFAITKENIVQVYHLPNCTEKQFNPLSLLKTYNKSYEEISCIDWADNNGFLVCGAMDSVIRFFTTKYYLNFGGSLSLTGHTTPIVAIFFFANSLNVMSISTNAVIYVWECDTDINNLKLNKEKKSFWDENKSEKDELEETNEKSGYNDAMEVIENMKTLETVPLLYYKKSKKFHFDKPAVNQNQKGLFAITCAAYNKNNRILATATNLGFFYIHEMPYFNHIQSLSICDYPISSITINSGGDWVAAASIPMGELTVWEWRSQNRVIKQASHVDELRCLAYVPSSDCGGGARLVMGSFDGKIKIWDTASAMCLMTFKEHTSAITDIVFTTKGNAFLSSSEDGTVRAFDLVRYRNFRTFTAPEVTQFACLTVDTLGEFVFAGSSASFEIYLWSMKTGKLLEVLSGHTGPVTSVQFDSLNNTLVSCSWDGNLKVWDVFGTKTCKESFLLGSEALASSIHPAGSVIAVSTLNGHITFWDTKECLILCSIDGGNYDLQSGRATEDQITAKNSLKNKTFTTLSFSPDGETLLAAGDSKYVCLYSYLYSRSPNLKSNSTSTGAALLKRFEITQNKSFDRTRDDATLNRRKMTEFGNLDSENFLRDTTALHDAERGGSLTNAALNLPGVKKHGVDRSSRFFRPEIRVACARFSPSGRSFSLASTEGSLIYSLDSWRNPIFDPLSLDLDLTPDKVKELMTQDPPLYTNALVGCLRLNSQELIREVLGGVPLDKIDYLTSTIPLLYILPLVTFVAKESEDSKNVEFYLRWSYQLLLQHGALMACGPDKLKFLPLFNLLQRSISHKYESLKRICNSNKFYLDYAKVLGNFPPAFTSDLAMQK